MIEASKEKQQDCRETSSELLAHNEDVKIPDFITHNLQNKSRRERNNNFLIRLTDSFSSCIVRLLRFIILLNIIVRCKILTQLDKRYFVCVIFCVGELRGRRRRKCKYENKKFLNWISNGEKKWWGYSNENVSMPEDISRKNLHKSIHFFKQVHIVIIAYYEYRQPKEICVNYWNTSVIKGDGKLMRKILVKWTYWGELKCLKVTKPLRFQIIS